MIEQIFESFRRSSESSMQAQQDIWKRWSQQWSSVSSSAATPMGLESATALQKRCIDLALDLLTKQRNSMDATYKSAIELLEQSARIGEVKTPDDYNQLVSEIWHKLFSIFKGQTEDQIRDLQSWAERSMDMARKAQAQA